MTKAELKPETMAPDVLIIFDRWRGGGGVDRQLRHGTNIKSSLSFDDTYKTLI